MIGIILKWSRGTHKDNVDNNSTAITMAMLSALIMSCHRNRKRTIIRSGPFVAKTGNNFLSERLLEGCKTTIFLLSCSQISIDIGDFVLKASVRVVVDRPPSSPPLASPTSQSHSLCSENHKELFTLLGQRSIRYHPVETWIHPSFYLTSLPWSLSLHQELFVKMLKMPPLWQHSVVRNPSGCKDNCRLPVQ